MQDYQINKYTINHPDPKVDLAALFIGELISQAAEYKKPLYYIGLSKEIIPSADKLKNLSALEEIIMVGYPIGIWDHVNNMPIFRKGITATHPSLDYQGRKEFLVDAACFLVLVVHLYSGIKKALSFLPLDLLKLLVEGHSWNYLVFYMRVLKCQ